MLIKYFAKNVYGNITYYFAEDTDATRAIQRLTGCTTLRKCDVEPLRALGIELALVLDPDLTPIA